MKKLVYFAELWLRWLRPPWVPVSLLGGDVGQQIKVFSPNSLRRRGSLGFMVPTIRKYGSLPEEQYEGATVLEAQKGAYYTPITALDFEALYPVS